MKVLLKRKIHKTLKVSFFSSQPTIAISFQFDFHVKEWNFKSFFSFALELLSKARKIKSLLGNSSIASIVNVTALNFYLLHIYFFFPLKYLSCCSFIVFLFFFSFLSFDFSCSASCLGFFFLARCEIALFSN